MEELIARLASKVQLRASSLSITRRENRIQMKLDQCVLPVAAVAHLKGSNG
jgi:hypothetical protein